MGFQKYPNNSPKARWRSAWERPVERSQVLLMAPVHVKLLNRVCTIDQPVVTGIFLRVGTIKVGRYLRSHPRSRQGRYILSSCSVHRQKAAVSKSLAQASTLVGFVLRPLVFVQLDIDQYLSWPPHVASNHRSAKPSGRSARSTNIPMRA